MPKGRLRLPLDWLLFLVPFAVVGLMVSVGVIAMKVGDLYFAKSPNPWDYQLPALDTLFVVSTLVLLALGAIYRWSGIEWVDLEASRGRSGGLKDALEPILVALPCGGEFDFESVDPKAAHFVCSKGCRHETAEAYEAFIAAEGGPAAPSPPLPLRLPCGGTIAIDAPKTEADAFVCSKGCRHGVEEVMDAAEAGSPARPYRWRALLGAAAPAAILFAAVAARWTLKSGNMKSAPVGGDQGLTLFGRSFGIVRFLGHDWSSVEVFIISGALGVLVWYFAAGLRRARDLNR